jgi:hypothetical protein
VLAVLATLAPSRMVRRARGLAFGGCVQSIEHDRGARRHPHQIRRCLAKPLADMGRPLREGSVEARAKCRDGGFGVAMKLTIQTGCECRISTRRSLWGSGLASLAEQRSDRFAGRARLERRSSGRSDFARNQSPNSVPFAALFDGARRLRCCRVSRFAGEGHCRIRFSIDPLLGVLCGTLFASLEDVMNSRRGAAVTLGNSGY